MEENNVETMVHDDLVVECVDLCLQLEPWQQTLFLAFAHWMKLNRQEPAPDASDYEFKRISQEIYDAIKSDVEHRVKFEMEYPLFEFEKAKALIAALTEQYNSGGQLLPEDNAAAHIAVQEILVGAIKAVKGILEDI